MSLDILVSLLWHTALSRAAYCWPFLTKITFLHFIYFNFLLHLVDQRKVDTKMNSPSCFYFNYPDNCWLKGIRNCHLTRYNLKKSSGCLANFTSLFAILLNFGFSTFFFLLHLFAFLCFPHVSTHSRSWCWIWRWIWCRIWCCTSCECLFV